MERELREDAAGACCQLLQTATQPSREASSNATALELLSALCQPHSPLALTTSISCCTDVDLLLHRPAEFLDRRRTTTR
jgi:hypothetical protein